jgi:hypothetical protein
VRVDGLIPAIVLAREAGPPALSLQSSDNRQEGILITIMPQGELVEPTAAVTAVEIESRIERPEAQEHHAIPTAAHFRSVLQASSEPGFERI